MMLKHASESLTKEVAAVSNRQGKDSELFYSRSLKINAGQLLLEDQGRIVTNTTSGEGDNFTVNVQELLSLRRESFIAAEAGGTGNGGATSRFTLIAICSGLTSHKPLE